MNAPLHCPYCADEDLWPQAEPAGAWRCRSCTRAFIVKRVRSTSEQPIGSQQDATAHDSHDFASTQENP